MRDEPENSMMPLPENWNAEPLRSDKVELSVKRSMPPLVLSCALLAKNSEF